MGLLEQLRSVWTGPITSSSPELVRLWTEPRASTGIAVSEQSALNYSAVFDAVWTISVQLASFPLIHYKRLAGGGKDRFTGSQLYELLDDAPNEEMSAPVFRETLQAHLLTWGNGYAEIERDVQGRPIALWPITPDRVAVVRDKYTQQIFYAVSRADGGQPDIIAASDMLHIPGLGYDGTVGYSVIAKARESIGLGLATERFGGTFFGNGSTFGGVLSHPSTLTKEVKQGIRESLEAVHGGVERAHKFVILGGGTKYERLGIPPEDAQFLETRAFQIDEVCRWFHLPPHKLKKLDRATNNNIEQQNLEYYIDCLAPWCKRWEKEIKRKLIPRAERRQQFVEHLVEGMLRGDIQSRYAAYAVGRQWGWLSADDVRERENMNPLPKSAGQIYLVPQNMAPADRINAMIDAQIQSKGPAAATPPIGGPDPNTLDPNARAAIQMAEGAIAQAAAVREEAQGRAELSAQQVEQAQREVTRLEALAVTNQTAHGAALEAARQHLATREAELQRAVDAALEARAAQIRAEADGAAAITRADEADRRWREDQQTRATAEAQLATAQQELARLQPLEGETQQARLAQTRAEADAAAAVVRAEAADRRWADDQQARAAAEAQFAAAQAEIVRLQALEGEAERARAAATAALATAFEAQGLAAAARTRAEEADQRWTEAQRELATGATRVTTTLEQATAADQARRDAEARALAAEATAIAQQAVATEADRQRHVAEAALETVRQATVAAETARQAAVLAHATFEDRERRRLVSVMAAHRALAVDAMGRLIRRETEKARRQQGSPDKLRTWVENFYVLHEETCREILGPVVRAHLAWLQADEDPAVVTQALVRAHIEESTRQLTAVAAIEHGGAFAPALEALLTRWDTDRANAFADTLFEKEIAYVRAES